MAEIGNVSIMYLKSYDALGNTYETNVSKGFIVKSTATYQEVDTAVRSINSLTTNTYDDTILVTNISVNDVLAEGGE